MNITNRQWKLVKRPEGDIKEGDLALVDSPVPDLNEGQFLVRNIYLSVDPTNRIWMSDIDQYMDPVNVGDTMRGGAIGVVEESYNRNFKKGDFVSGGMAWESYAVLGGGGAVPASKDLPLTSFMSVLGVTGFTAYFGLLDLGKPQPGETVVVSAAAGAVGSIVGQIAKIKGCRVVGIAGGPEKCAHIKEKFGFDAAVDYKAGNVLEDLRTACPDGIDVYFENVGGDILDAVLTLLNLNARIPLCGLISSYNAADDWAGPKMFRNILMKRATVTGFIVTDFMPRFGEAIGQLTEWIQQGKIKWDMDVVDGIENTLDALDRLFTGKNIGKQLVRISDDPTA
jgi:hypothetical protein